MFELLQLGAFAEYLGEREQRGANDEERPNARAGCGDMDRDADVECLVISTDGIRVLTGGTTADILIRFDECP